MDKSVQVAGIDVSKDKLDVHILAGISLRAVSVLSSVATNAAWAIWSASCARPASARSRSKPAAATSARSSKLWRRTAWSSTCSIRPVCVASPRRPVSWPRPTQWLGYKPRIDARLIALYCQHFPGTGLTRRPEKASRLSEFLVVRGMLRKAIDEARNRLEHLREPALRRLVERTLESARADLKSIDADIVQVIEEDEEMRRKAEILRSMIGVGPVLTGNLLARMPELGQTGRRPAALLCGVAPADKRSGKSRRRSTIAGGRDDLRPILHMVALAAIRRNPTIAAFASRLAANGKSKRLIIAACSRKIIVILNAMLRDQTHWRSPQNT